MLQCIVYITLTQKTAYVDSSGASTPRNETFKLNFCHSFEVYSSWKDLSDTATIEIPKNVYVKDANNSNIIWGDSATPDKMTGYVNMGGFSSAQVSKLPLIMRGDAILIEAGYSYISNVNQDGSLDYTTTTNPVFSGYVSSLEMKSTLKLHCEDNMWLLKQTNMPTHTYGSGKNDIKDVLEDIVANVNKNYKNANLTPDTNGFTLSVNGFKTENETAAEVLKKLCKLMPSMGFYFRGNVLRGGGVVYYYKDQSAKMGSDGKPFYNSFNFQKNIISDELHYSLKSDVKVGAVCYSVSSKAGSGTNKMGGAQYTTSRLQTTIGVQHGDSQDGYEYFTFYFKDIKNEDDLKKKGQTYLNRYQYDGFRGKFTTFGLPFVQHGNIIYVTDNLFPERNGHYMVKAAHCSFSIDAGLRQEIELHFRTDGIAQSVLQQGM